MRTAFFARINGATGGFQSGSALRSNPFNPQSVTCTPVKLAPGNYRLTFGFVFDRSNYQWEFCLENSFGNLISPRPTIVSSTVFEIDFADNIGTDFDCDWWIHISEIGGTYPG